MKVFIIAIITQLIYSEGFPVTEIKLNKGQVLSYELKFELDLQTRHGNQTLNSPSSIDIKVPFEVLSLSDSSYILETKTKDLKGTTLVYDSANDQMLGLDISQLFESSTYLNQTNIYEIDKKGNLISSDLLEGESAVLKLLDYFSIYSGGFFVSLPEVKNKGIWKKTLTTETHSDSKIMDFVIDQNFKYVGEEEFQESRYHKINYFVDNVQFDNPIMEMIDAKLESQISGFFLVDDNGIVKLSLSKGKITLSADLNKLSDSLYQDESDGNKIMGLVMNVSSRMYLK